MRYLIYHFLLLILVHSCGSGVPNHKLWIHKGHIIDNPDGSRSVAGGGRLVLDYKKDSLEFCQFFYDLAEPAYDYGIAPLRLERDKGGIVAGPSKEGTFFRVATNNDSIRMVAIDDSLYRYTFEPLPRYNQASNKVALETLLVNNTITLSYSALYGDDFRVEFLPSGRVISKEIMLGDYGFWNVATYQDELFLVFDGFTGAAFHIKDISGARITAMTYGMNGRKATWEATPVIKRFDQSLLLGAWVQDMGEEHEAMYTELLNKDYKTFQSPELFIDSLKILVSRPSRLDTIYWIGNREGDLIRTISTGAYWTIKTLTEDTLVLSESRHWGVKTRRFARK